MLAEYVINEKYVGQLYIFTEGSSDGPAILSVLAEILTFLQIQFIKETGEKIKSLSIIETKFS